MVNAITSVMTDFWGFLKTLLTFTAGIVIIISNPANWFIYFSALAAKLLWTLIPDFVKRPVVEFLIEMSIKGLKYISPPTKLGSLWDVVIAGTIGFLERIQKKGVNQQMLFIEKLINTVINPSYYSGLLVGVIKGIVWDGLVGLIKSVIDIFVMLPDFISGIYNFFKELLTDIASIKKILKTIVKLKKDVEKFINDPKLLDQIVNFIKKSPKILLSMAEKAFETAQNWAKEAGAKLADSLFKFVLSSDAFTIGLEVGTIIGMILFEILLLVFSGSIGNAVKWGSKALSWIGKGLKLLVKGLKTGGGWIMRGFKAIQSIASAGWKVVKSAVKGTLSKVFNRLKKLMDDIIAWFKKTFARAFGKKKPPKKRPRPKRKPTPGEIAAFKEFQARVQTGISPFRVMGISKKELRRVIRRARKPRRIKSVIKFVRIPHGRTKKTAGRYVIKAFVDFFPGSKKVGKILRLPTGESRKEAISIHWYKRGYPNPISTHASRFDPSEWNPNIAPPPAPTNQSFSMDGDEIEVPSRRYRSFLRARDHTVTRGGQSVTIKKVRIGVARKLRPYRGKVMKRTYSTNASRTVQSKFRDKLLEPNGFDWRNMEADHVQDLAWGGSRLDKIANLWPLSSSANNAGNEVYRQTVHYQNKKTGKKGTKKPMKLFNKWFKIRSHS